MNTAVVAGAEGAIIEPNKPAAPAHVEVKLGDKAFQVPPEVAKELETAKRAAADAGLAKDETERKLAEALKAAEKPKAPANQGDELETLIFTDPKSAIARIKEEVAAGIRAEQAVVQNRDAFWVSFYEENPGLKDADIVVKAVMTREFEALKPMALDKAREHLAEATQKELLRLGIQRKTGKSKPVGEGGNEPAGKRPKNDVGERPLTGGLSAILKERAAAKREAAVAD